jgi:TolB-like protein
LNKPPSNESANSAPISFIARLRRRGVLRVAVSYAVIAWLLLQIGDVVLEPLDAPAWVMRALIMLLAVGFPIAILLAWFLELGPSGISVDRLPQDAERPKVGGRRKFADVIIIGVLLAVIALLLLRQEGLLEPEAKPPVIAVLPFTDLGASEESYYADGLSDTLIHKLGQLSGLVVLASSSSFQFRGSGLQLAEVAAKLGADNILEGTLQRAAGVLRVNARLVDPATGQQRWTASFNRRTEELFDVQDEIAAAITSALQVVLTPQEQQRLVHRDTLNLSAFEAYQRARHELAQRTDEGMTRALQYLFDATETDPEFALAWASLPEAYFLGSAYHLQTPWQEVAEAAQAAADRAVQLDPGLGDAYLAQAFVNAGNLQADGLMMPPYVPDPATVALLEKAISLSPSNAVAWKLLADFTADKHLKLERYLRAAQLDPRHPNIINNLGSIYESVGEVEKGRHYKMLALGLTDPPFWQAAIGLVESYSRDPDGLASAARWARAIMLADEAQGSDSWRDYCRALAELGAVDEVLNEHAKRAAKVPDPDASEQLYRLGRLVQINRQMGDMAEAARNAGEFEKIYRRARGVSQGKFNPTGPPAALLDAPAILQLQLGQPAEAIAYYEGIYENVSQLPFFVFDTMGLNARLVHAAALKQLGQKAEADANLRAYLEEVKLWPPSEVPGLIPFAIHALLGETDAAIAAFRKAVELNQVSAWWALKDGAIDADFARVLADPRFQEAFGKLEQSVARQREDFLANPDLPLDVRITAGLTN